MKIMVSACLLGDNVKYDGTNNKNEELIDFLQEHEIYKICPEVIGGLTIPRIPCEIQNDLVINKEGKNVTTAYYKGANKALEMAKKNHIQVAILKEKSPSCGSKKIYNGKFNHQLITGAGITTRLLEENNIIVLNEDNYQEYFKKVGVK